MDKIYQHLFGRQSRWRSNYWFSSYNLNTSQGALPTRSTLFCAIESLRHSALGGARTENKWTKRRRNPQPLCPCSILRKPQQGLSMSPLPHLHCSHDPCCALYLVLLQMGSWKFICRETQQFQGKFLKVLA